MTKRYQFYPKCPTHNNDPISLCNGCLVSILNVDQCPYGCEYAKKENKGVKITPPVINQTGFLILYPKRIKDSQYLEFINIKQIVENGKLDKWESLLKKIRYDGK